MQLLSPRARNAQLPLLVFLPGMDGSGQLLHRQLDGLESRFDIRCLSLPPDDLSSWASLVEQVVDLIEAERESNFRSIYLCGESFGGCLAMKVVTARPSLFQHLILINPASSFNRIPLFQWGSPLSNLLPEPLYKLSSGILVQFLVEFNRVMPADRQTLVDSMLQVSPQTAAWRLHLLRQFDLNAVGLASLTIPALLIAGACDRLLPSQQEIARLSQQIAHAQTYILPHSGHACLLEKAVSLGDIFEQRGL